MSFGSTFESKRALRGDGVLILKINGPQSLKLGASKVFYTVETAKWHTKISKEFLVAEENRSGRKKKKTISIGSTPSSTTEIPKTSENSNNPSKKEKSGKTMTLKEGRVVKRQKC